MHIIGIDIGTGSTKAVAVSHSGETIASTRVPYPTLNAIPGRSEQDPEVIWQAFVRSLSEIVTQTKQQPLAVSLSCAMHSLIPVDKSGKALHPVITWADNRSASVASRLISSPSGKRLYEETGTPLHAMSPLCKIIWLRENDPELFSRTARFISIKEFIWFRLFNVFEVDYSIASASGLFNINTLRWHEYALEVAGITNERLSIPVNTDHAITGAIQTNELPEILRNVSFVIGSSDGCLANKGSYATAPGIAALTIGTSGAIRVARQKPALNWDHMTFNYRLNENVFISGGPINNGGIALKWYAEKLLGKEMNSDNAYAELLSKLSDIPAGSEGLIFLPYLFGERAPIWNSNSFGVFFGITGQHGQEHFTKAVIEGILFSLYQIMRGIENDGDAISRIHVSGGFVRSRQWVQMLATIFGKKVVLVNREDASAIGAAFLGFDALGVQGDYEKFLEADAVAFDPQHKLHEFYRECVFPLFDGLYKTLAPHMEQLHQLKSRKNVSTTPLTEEQKL